MTLTTGQQLQLPLRFGLLEALHEAHDAEGWLSRGSVTRIAHGLRMPVAEAWEAATSYPDFHFESRPSAARVCTGLSCQLAGARGSSDDVAAGCQFRCYDAPAPGEAAAFSEAAVRLRGPLTADDITDDSGLSAARTMERSEALAAVAASGLRGRGGAYFPVATKWSGALSQGRPLALVVNAEEGEPGVFKDRALLCRRPRRFLEGLAIARHVLQPVVTVIFINGEAGAAVESLRTAIRESGTESEGIRIVRGGGGYVLGEETTLLNALEGRKPAPRIRPPYPVESGLFGLPTVVNNVETLANLSVLFRAGVEAFRALGTAESPGTKLLSVSGQIKSPGLYEVPFGTSLADVIKVAGGAVQGEVSAVLAGGPSGGFLPPALFDVPLLPGHLHGSGAVTGSGGLVALDSSSDIRWAALEMAAFNARESCGKCTPCREGTPRAAEALAAGDPKALPDLLDALQFGSLCGLGQMAPGPIRSALEFWPELFR